MSRICIIGVRGIPNRYGGFERLIEVLAPHLASQGHEVIVYCERGPGDPQRDEWNGVVRHFIAADAPGPLRTLQYDWRSFAAVPRDSVALIFGYGTACFQGRLKLKGVRHAVNMDGIEWKRSKWGLGARLWLRCNERAAIVLSDQLIADHPEIQSDLRRRFKVDSEMIAYGVDLPGEPAAASPAHELLERYTTGSFDLVIARPEPENQIHLIVQAHAASSRSRSLLVIGNFASNEYGRRLMADFPQVDFGGPVYEPAVLDALRSRSTLYLHGHSVGGTNPSLIEAMAAGALVVAHDNPFNRWVLGEGGLYFASAQELTGLLDSPPTALGRQSLLKDARRTCRARFLWRDVLAAYDDVVRRLSGQQ